MPESESCAEAMRRVQLFELSECSARKRSSVVYRNRPTVSTCTSFLRIQVTCNEKAGLRVSHWRSQENLGGGGELRHFDDRQPEGLELLLWMVFVVDSDRVVLTILMRFFLTRVSVGVRGQGSGVMPCPRESGRYWAERCRKGITKM